MKHTIFLSVIFMLLPMVISADEVEIDGIYYNLAAKIKEAEVTSNPNLYSGSVNIPSSVIYKEVEYRVTSICQRAFYDCSNLTSVSLPNSVTSIGSVAFAYCRSLKSLNIPYNVTNIGLGAFMGCMNLEAINVDKDNKNYESPDKSNCIIEKDSKKLIVGCDNTVIPEDVVTIGAGAFNGCLRIKNISIPNNVKDIESSAFMGCTGMCSIELPNNLESIGAFAFQSCNKLTSIKIPQNVKSIGEGIISGCSEMISVTVDINNAYYDSREDCDAIIESSSNTLIAGVVTTKIPQSVTKIGQSAFAYCTNLTSFIVPNNIISIETAAFKGCDNLNKIVLSDNLTTIRQSAFSNCINLSNFTIPNSVTTIESFAFYECSNLTSMTIPSSVVSIGKCVFAKCISLSSIYIPNSLISVPQAAFSGCWGLKDVIISDGIETIEHDAFMDCIRLKTIIIPNSIQYIGQFAFGACVELKDFYCYAESVPGSSSAFGFDNSINSLKDAILHVPVSSLEAYKRSAQWSAFGNIIALTENDPRPTSVKSLKSDEHVYPIANYTLDGIRKSESQHGLNILRMSDGRIKKVIIR